MTRTLRHVPVVANRRVGVLISVALLLAWALFTWAQFDRAGNKPPWFMRWATWW
jgi:hypothetical protein